MTELKELKLNHTKPKTKSAQTSEAPKPKPSPQSNSGTEVQDQLEKSFTEQGEENTLQAPEHTIFIGNLPVTVKKSDLKTLFKKYGTIRTIRFRTNNGRVVWDKKDLQDVPSLIAYVRFSSKEEMKAACEMNGQMVGTNRIRVSPQDQKQIGNVKSTVFVGNIRKGTTENELYEFFGRVGPIEYIRYLSMKNIAYVCFAKGVSIRKALKLHQEKLNDRPLRIGPVDTQRTNVKVNKKGHLVPRKRLPIDPKKATDGDGGGAAAAANDANHEFHGTVSKKKNNKKRISHKSGVGSAKHRRMLASKLKAAMHEK